LHLCRIRHAGCHDKGGKGQPRYAFAIVDVEATVPANNLRGVVFANDEAGYLAGTVAGLMTESGVVGAVGATVGGMHIPAVDAYLVPYGIGAACARLQTTVLVTYTDTFGDPGLGAQVAQQMLNQGTDMIFAAAGPTGNGAILKATQSGAWTIGVDVDQYVTLFQNGGVTGADRLLTSAAKRVDNAIYDTIADVMGGTFSGGTVTYGLAEEGVGLAPWHEAGPQVPQSVRDAVDNIEQGIVNGSIDIYEPCRPTSLYLPSVFSGASR
jgi:basic membrane protein A